MEALKEKVANGQIDTVITAIPDMQGRLMGKRFHAEFFLESAWEETHCCNYLLATDLEMYTVDGYASTSWSAGYGDYVMKPDMATLRLLPWLEGTAMVTCDLLDHHTHALVPHAPRSVLKQQISRLQDMGLAAAVATELEFFVFRENFEEMRDKGYRDMTTISPYNEDYHIF
ncbi:MAG: glutamine synthetase, partial [Gammaproteobacteria bacterium]|nr:glutamine synthetase [Gammaproteobacteria bacterium]